MRKRRMDENIICYPPSRKGSEACAADQFTATVSSASCLGLECANEICWVHWRHGDKIKKQITIKNVGLKTAVICYKPPLNKSFFLPLPKAHKVPPGITISIPVTYQPQTNEPTEEKLYIFTEKGGFDILLKAKAKEAAVRIPDNTLAFGAVAVGREERKKIVVENTGSTDIIVKWKVKNPFFILPSVFKLPINGSESCTVAFAPTASCTYTANAICELIASCEDEDDSPSSQNNDFNIKTPFHTVGNLKEAKNATTPANESFSGASQTVRTLQMQIEGSGKIPYLLIEEKTEKIIDFGQLYPGEIKTHFVTLTNTSNVLAEFAVRTKNPKS